MTRRDLWMTSVILAIGFCAGACRKNAPVTSPTLAPSVVAPAAPVRPPAPAPPRAAAPAPPPAPLSEEEIFRRKSLAELNAERPLSDVFFDYDETRLRDDAREALQRDAVWLQKWRQTNIRVDGHCDERGTAEYNLALGSRRASAVRDYLVSLGISGDRIRVSSLGNEAPFCRDANETCWSQNRRGHFVIVDK